jgi:hypothetical protein
VLGLVEHATNACRHLGSDIDHRQHTHSTSILDPKDGPVLAATIILHEAGRAICAIVRKDHSSISKVQSELHEPKQWAGNMCSIPFLEFYPDALEALCREGPIEVDQFYRHEKRTESS